MGNIFSEREISVTNYYVSYLVKILILEPTSLFIWGRGKDVYILPSSDLTLSLLLVRFTEYDDDL
ncbi:hypothetical protein Hanom_Chr01g00054661 [Helianthus anomalus]